jgi:hypothetical protein
MGDHVRSKWRAQAIDHREGGHGDQEPVLSERAGLMMNDLHGELSRTAP